MLHALVKQHALEIGFDLVGIAPVAAHADLQFSREWVERGYGGEMRYLENPKRDDPRRILPSAQSVICVGLIYNADLPYSTEIRRQESEVRSQESGAGRKKTGTSKQGGGSIGLEAKIEKPAPNSEFEACPGARGPLLPLVTNHSSGFRDRGWISRYAWGTDYHDVMRSKLEKLRTALRAMAPGTETRVYVDTGPIVERAFARLSGIGWTGKNTCLINEAKGSWFFLGVIITSLDLAPDLPAPDRCGSCTACIEACPTDALVQPYVMDASRCIAYLNIELKGSIPEKFRSAIGANVVGCDICQDVCPWNSKDIRQGGAPSTGAVVSGRLPDGIQLSAASSQRRKTATTQVPEFQPLQFEAEVSAPRSPGDNAERVSNFDFQVSTHSLFNPSLEALASLDENDFRRIFRRSPVKRVKYRGWLRNLCVAMGNSGDGKFLPRLQRLREHDDPLIREHAEWAIAQLTTAIPSGPEDESKRTASHL
ncbi:MAG: tRNA epoxyqueuosine(34) reductase QueG [Terriglobia bacterium]